MCADSRLGSSEVELHRCAPVECTPHAGSLKSVVKSVVSNGQGANARTDAAGQGGDVFMCVLLWGRAGGRGGEWMGVGVHACYVYSFSCM